MMGAAIAYVCAKAGIEVVLKDVAQEAAERGKGYSQDARRQGRRARPLDAGEGRRAARAHHADRPTRPRRDGADLVIEAVFEDPEVKAQVFAEIEPHLADGALLGSNTSTLPITGLAEGVSRPADFIGLHFFSPVDKMPLLEIIKGEQTSDETLYRALDVAKQIKKTPIVVNDSRGFFTSRVIGTFINEGIAMLTEGVPAPTIEQASSQAGYPAPVLQLSDELNLELMRRSATRRKAAIEADGGELGRPPVLRRSSTRCSTRAAPASSRGAGFYDYEDGKRTGLWPGLREAFPPVDDPSAISLKDLEERMLFVEALETVKCLDEGVIESVADANIGSIIGHRLPGLDRRRAAVHQRLRRRRRRLRRPRARAGRPSTASASSRRPRWSRRPSAARRTPTRATPVAAVVGAGADGPAGSGAPGRLEYDPARCRRTPMRCWRRPPVAPPSWPAPGLSPARAARSRCCPAWTRASTCSRCWGWSAATRTSSATPAGWRPTTRSAR